MQVQSYLLLLFVFLSLLQVSLSTKYTWTLKNKNGVTVQTLQGNEVINIDSLDQIQIIINKPGGTWYVFQDVVAKTSASSSYTSIPGYYSSFTALLSPTSVFWSNVFFPSDLDISKNLKKNGFNTYKISVREYFDSGYETLYLYVEKKGDVCSRIQSGGGQGIICKNGATCVPETVGNSCKCSSGYTGNDCSGCAPGFTGTNCKDCLANYYGPSCLACPNCNNGVCNSGKTGNGACICNLGWKSSGTTYCKTCNTGFTGSTCNQCLSGYYGSQCLSCPSCGSRGSCSDGMTGTGDCICQNGWADNGSKKCSVCAPNFYSSTCKACPNCGAHGTCKDGLSGDGSCTCNAGWVNGVNGVCSTCAPGYYGPNCLKCPACGINSFCDEGMNGSGTCTCQTGWAKSTRGLCEVCDSGYYGENCNLCPNCGAHGTCDEGVVGDKGGTGVCNCQTGWVNGVNGVCSACAPGYYGPNCLACPDCGHGACDEGVVGDTGGTGVCTCQNGWTNNNGNCNACQPGYYGSSCLKCPDCGHGTCDEGVVGDTGGSGNCNCQTGWVNGVNGFCSACASGYYGPTCLECPNCGANGHCSEGVIGDMGGDGSCICNFGWASIENPSNSTGYCNKCAPGFAGTNCNVCDIGFQGLNCDQCKPGFSGQSCNICEAGTFPDCYSPISCPLGCSSNGECNDRNGQCSCHVGFKNSGCNTCIWDTDIYPNCSPGILCPNNCTNNGVCDGFSGNCTCLPEYGSPACNECQIGYKNYPECYEIQQCPNNCSSKGDCNDRTGECSCYDTFTGPTCNDCAPGYLNPDEGCWQIIECQDLECSNHGTCNIRNGVCTCDSSHAGENCEKELHCINQPCLNGGTCNELLDSNTFLCDCLPHYAGSICQYERVPPVLISLSPSILPLEGGIVNVTGKNFQSPLVIIQSFMNVTISTLNVTSFSSNLTTGIMDFSFFVSPINETGFITLTFINPPGDQASDNSIYMTGDCPMEGYFGVGTDCIPCPEGAVCPGGNRIWPLPGYWNPNQQTIPQPCQYPPSRCAGGEDSSCSTGYVGDFCAFCDTTHQYNDTSLVCDTCPSGDCSLKIQSNASLTFFVICIIIVIVVLLIYLFYRCRRKLAARHKKSTSKRPSRRPSFLPIPAEDSMDTRRLVPSRESEESEVSSKQSVHYFNTQDQKSKLPPTIWETPFDNRLSWTLPSTFVRAPQNHRVPQNEIEAICLDQILKTIPTKQSLYRQILRTNRIDLVIAKIGNQVARKIIKLHSEKITQDNEGNSSDFVNEAQTQKYVDQYLESIGWRVVGTINALSKKGAFGLNGYIQQPYDLPYSIQVIEDRGSKSVMLNHWFVQLHANELMGLGSQPNVTVLTLFEGFGGPEVSEYSRKHLHVNIMRNQNFQKNPYNAIYEGFLQTNDGIAANVSRKIIKDDVGCSAIFTMIRGHELWCAWTGNCQAVLFKSNGGHIPLTEPHTLDKDTEMERIEQDPHHLVDNNGIPMLGGITRLSRGLGCVKLAGVFTAEPEIISLDLQGNEDFLVIGSESVWRVVSMSALSGFLSQFRLEHEHVADALLKYVRSLGATDNCSISVLAFSRGDQNF